MREMSSAIFPMRNVDSDNLQMVIGYMYEQPINLTEKNILDVTDTAEYLQVRGNRYF